MISKENGRCNTSSGKSAVIMEPEKLEKGECSVW